MRNGKSVIVVGSGIAGLICAFELSKKDYNVVVITKSPDSEIPDKDFQSSTFDGQDQRYITLFESHPYLELFEYEGLYPNITDDFRRETAKGGALGSHLKNFDNNSKQWLEERFSVNRKLLSNTYTRKKIKELFILYENENRASMAMWYRLLYELIKEDRRVLKNLSLNYKGIIRLYDREDVFNRSLTAHKEGNVLKTRYSAQELASKYKAYQKGIKNGLIKGGAFEVYGIALGIKSFCRELIKILKKQKVRFVFSTEIVSIERGGDGLVLGIRDQKGTFHSATHYTFQSGAYTDQKLFEGMAEARNKLAAVEGYWIVIENAHEIIKKMAYKPNKVHGKKTLKEILQMLNAQSRKRFMKKLSQFQIHNKDLHKISPVADFNIMPIKNSKLGIGSGYVYLGFGKRDKKGRLGFIDSKKAQTFVQIVMQMWLEALYGKLLNAGKMRIIRKGCKRSWTPDDEELDVTYLTNKGGILDIHGGGNTGTTAKSLFIAKYILNKMKKVEGQFENLSNKRKKSGFLSNKYFQRDRASLQVSSNEYTPKEWEKMIKLLDSAV